MTWLRLLAIGFGLVGSAPWIWLLLHYVRHHRMVLFLPELPDPPSGLGRPRVAIIFAARDEARGIEAATRSMLAQGGENLSVVAVDDRSIDGSAAILERIAQESDGRLAIVSIRDLPDGWLGKTNALQRGAEIAREADWLLLTDADVRFAPGTVARAVHYAETAGIDHLAVAPEIVTESVGERTFVALFGMIFSMYSPIGRLANDRSRAAIGIGAFNLVRGQVFRDIGGFNRLAMSVDDDLALGRAIKYSGYRSRFMLGQGDVSVRWQVGTLGMIKGLEKNFFAGLKFRLLNVGLIVFALAALGFGPFIGVMVGPGWARGLAALGLGSIVLIFAASSRQSRIPWWYAALLPAASILLIVALVRSAAATIMNRGVVWRGHLYPMAALKRHVLERDRWLEEVWRSTRA